MNSDIISYAPYIVVALFLGLIAFVSLAGARSVKCPICGAACSKDEYVYDDPDTTYYTCEEHGDISQLY